jgi:acyl dehydratase
MTDQVQASYFLITSQDRNMSQVTNTPYEALEVGQKAEYTKTVEERHIQLFAEMSGDRNPVHLDEAFASKTMFKDRIAHGMFSGALISAAVACELPGPGTIYLGQEMSFQKPVKIGDTLTVRLEILEKLPKFKVRIATNVFNQNGELVVEGEAQILAPRKEQTVTLAELPTITVG